MKDLKEGKRSPIYLVEKYSGQRGPSKPEIPLVKQHYANGPVDETSSAGIAPDWSGGRPVDLTTIWKDGCDLISVSDTLSVSPPYNISIKPVGDICGLVSEEHPVNASRKESSTEIFAHPSSATDFLPLSPLQPKSIKTPRLQKRRLNHLNLRRLLILKVNLKT